MDFLAERGLQKLPLKRQGSIHFQDFATCPDRSGGKQQQFGPYMTQTRNLGSISANLWTIFWSGKSISGVTSGNTFIL